MEIKNLKKAATRIRKAIKNKERIIIYGDSDMDGVCSVIILKECIKNLGGDIVEIYFPDRETEGYGINKIALNNLRSHAPALLIALDLGIGNFKEVDIANKMGFSVIIIDHHEIPDKVPNADIVVDPKQEGDKYPFKLFANVGLVYRLSVVLLKNKMTESLRKDFLELAAMATIADMMPQTDDNEEIILEGLSSLRNSWRPGIQALLELEFINSLSLMYQVNKMNSLMNLRDIGEKTPTAFRLLTISNIEDAGRMVEKLLEKSIEKKRKIKDILEQVEARISFKKNSIIFEGDSSWELVLLGIVCSITTQKHNKPVFLYRKDKEDSQGSIRAPKDHNVVEAMKTCSRYFMTYGGHPTAAGFRAKNKNLDKAKECLIEYYYNK
ncbi:DHH family phosphoesterase [Patescibacteria group bacterium]|nr:DHH family phosphoesterase [Patescibacteria group bacterium]